MKKDLTQPTTTALSANFAEKLLSGIAESRATTVIGGGGKPFLRLKNGNWIFGQQNEEVQEGSHWVVNTMSLAHGYCCWVETDPKKPNELRGEVMISMTQPKPARPVPIEGTPYAEQRSFEAKCISGADAGTEVLYKNASIGGMRAIDDILIEIQNQLLTEDGVNYPCPVVRLEVSDYDHKKHGQTFVPIFEVIGWADMEGQLAPATAAPAAAPEPPAPKPTSRAKPAKPPLKDTKGSSANGSNDPADDPDLQLHRLPPREAPVSTTQAHVGQRRRPTAR